ncbi:MAG: YjbQ family protein [Thermotogae bacterium]|nr:YjbQ family protein [Thermotogota bacterium]
MLREITLRTSRRSELVDITEAVRAVVRRSGIKSGICVLYCPHTTAALTVNENADPSVRVDINDHLSDLVPPSKNYRHLEGNADSHIKSVLVGPSLTLIVEDGDIVLGTWQGVFFCEFDGPRNRRVLVKLMEG